jgi:hypothetical protein
MQVPPAAPQALPVADDEVHAVRAAPIRSDAQGQRVRLSRMERPRATTVPRRVGRPLQVIVGRPANAVPY